MKRTITLLSLLTFFACRHQQDKKEYALLNKASWFLGEWQSQSSYGNFSEKWEKLSDSTMMGATYIVKDKDTIFEENIVLEQRNDSLFYNVLFKENNQEKSTIFYLSKSTTKELIFENPKHDFPTKIVYNLINPDSILASIHGKQKGIDKTEFFPMSKKK